MKNEDVRAAAILLGMAVACVGAGLLWGVGAVFLTGGVMLWHGARG